MSETPRSSPPGSTGRALPALLFAAVVAAVWADPLFTSRNFTGMDLVPYNLPMEKTIHDAYAAGALPVWSPHISGGRPILPNPNAGALYPLRPLLSALPFPVAMRVYPVLHWVLAGVGMLLLLSSIGASRGAAWIGAATYVFSGVSASEVFYPHIQPGMAMLPWILWTVARRHLAPTRRVLWLGALFGLVLLAADVFTAALSILAAVLWLAIETDRSEQFRELLLLAAGVALGGLVAAPQIVATALWIPETNRAVIGMKLYEVTFFTISPWRLLELVVPYPFGPAWSLSPREIWGTLAFNYKSLSLFATLYAGALAPIALFLLWREKRPGLRFARTLLLVGTAVSVLPSLMPRSWHSLKSPLPLRNPEKFAVAIVLGLAIFAALGYEAYCRRRPGRVVIGIGVLFAAAALLASAWPLAAGRVGTLLVNRRSDLAPLAAPQLPAALAEAGLLWVATLLGLEAARRGGRGAALISLALLTAVPLAATRRIAKIAPQEEIFAPTPFAMRVKRADPRGFYRVLGESLYRPLQSADPYELTDFGRGDEPRRAWTEHTHALWGYGTVFNSDFDSGDLSRLESLRRVSSVAAGYRDSSPFFGNLSLRWGIRMRNQEPVSSYRQIGGDGALAWDELRQALPDIRLATRWREEGDSLAALTAIRDVGPGELLLETGRRGEGSARPGQIRILEKSAARLRLEIEAPDATWLFVLRSFWTHRTVLLDGHPVDSVPAYLAFSAVPVPAGRHQIDWRERVPGGRVSRFGPLLAAAAFTLLLVADRRRKKGA
jgi:hypothetical protein